LTTYVLCEPTTVTVLIGVAGTGCVFADDALPGPEGELLLPPDAEVDGKSGVDEPVAPVALPEPDPFVVVEHAASTAQAANSAAAANRGAPRFRAR
jgi:hypothetical protein